MENVNTLINFSLECGLGEFNHRKAQNSPAFEKLDSSPRSFKQPEFSFKAMFSPPLLSCNRCANICLVNFSSNPETDVLKTGTL